MNMPVELVYRQLPKSVTQAPRLNAEIFSIAVEPSRYIIYAPLRRAAFVANAALVNQLVDIREGQYDQESDPDDSLINFLRQLAILDGTEELPPIAEFSGPPCPTTVSLFLTTACNLRCTYCYASAGDTPKKFMTLDVAKRGIDFVAENAAKLGRECFEVAYHGGGEPSLNWNTMTDSLSYAHEKATALGLKVNAGAATNGVLSDKQIDWMIANLASVSLSFDGLPDINDQHRILVNGQGSSERIVKTLARFDAANFRYGIRLTVTQDQIASLPKSVDYICSNFHPVRIQVEPVYQLGRGNAESSAETEEFIASYREAQCLARDHGHDLYFSAARLDTLTNHFCGVSQDSFCLSPDGNVSACYEVFSEDSALANVFFYGKPEVEGNGYHFDDSALQHLRQQSVQHRPYCQGCFAKWHCAGDCYHKSLAQSASTEFKGSARCHITRELIKDQLLDRIAAAGGLFWHEPSMIQPDEGEQT